MKDELEKLLIELLHRFDHEPDEITKYVVIDQTEFVPEALTSIINLVDKEVPEKLSIDDLGPKEKINRVEYARFYQAYNHAIDDMRAIIRSSEVTE